MLDAVATPVALIAMVSSLYLAAAIWRRTGRQIGAVVVFLVGSVLLVDVGFLLNAIAEGMPGWAARGALVTSLGTLAAAVGATLALPSTTGGPRRSRLLPVGDTYRRDLAVAAGVLLVSALYFVLLGYIPLVSTLLGLAAGDYAPGMLNTLRTTRDVHIAGDLAETAVPLAGLFDVIRYFAVPTVFLAFLSRLRAPQARTRAALAVMVVSAFFVVATGQRWPLLYTLVGAAMLFLQGRSPRWRWRVVRGFLAGLLGVVAISALLGRGLRQSRGVVGDLLYGAVDLVDRAIFGGVEVPFRSYLVLQHEPPMLGATWVQNLLAYVPGTSSSSFPLTFYQLVTGDRIGYTSPPDFYTEAYLNLGIAGVAVLSFLWGVALRRFDERFAVGGAPDHLGNAYRAVLLTALGLSFSSGVAFTLGVAIVGVGIHWLGSTQTELERLRARV